MASGHLLQKKKILKKGRPAYDDSIWGLYSQRLKICREKNIEGKRRKNIKEFAFTSVCVAGKIGKRRGVTRGYGG